MSFTRNQIDSILSYGVPNVTADTPANPEKAQLAVERGIIALFKLQTADEQRRADTNYLNKVGFCMTDARVGTRFARWLMGMDDSNRVRYPAKSLAHPKADKVFRRYKSKASDGTVIGRARDICLRHSRQLTAIANGEDPATK